MMKKLLTSISHSGVNVTQTVSFTDKLIARNHLALICAFFSSMYLFYFLNNGYVIGSICILISIISFVLSIVFNHFHYFIISKSILILVTNFSVLFTSLLFGFNSGFHLYLLTAPLITFMLFEPKQRVIILLSILSYCINFFFLIFLYKYYNYEMLISKVDQSNQMYLINFTFTIFIIITLLLYYSNNNLKVNSLLNKKNEELLNQQLDLKNEISVRKNAEEELVSLLADKNLLIFEINHRVKNNLAVISGLLELENIYINDEIGNRVIKDNKNRIKAIALLHEQLYKNENTGKINIKEFLSELKHNCVGIYSHNIEKIIFRFDVNSNDLTIDLALPLGLIINELIVDSIKQSNLNSEVLEVEISIEKNGDTVNISYIDSLNRDDRYIENHESSYSYILIAALTSQLNGKYIFDLNKGVNFKMNFNDGF